MIILYVLRIINIIPTRNNNFFSSALIHNFAAIGAAMIPPIIKPKTIWEYEANEMKAKFEEAGATIELK